MSSLRRLLPSLGVCLTLSCAEPATPVDVVLIVVDTLRSDGLGCGGAPARQSPELDALAARSAQFRTCVSQSPWTIPALGSIVTGHYPSTHGANWLSASLSESVPTLAERFRDAGWATAGIVSHYLAGERHGFARGFDHFDERNAAGHRHISSKILTDFALDWLDDQTGPSFLFVHYFDPHYDYRTHRGFTQTEAYGGAVEPGTDIWELRAAADDLDADDLAHLRELYAGEIRFMDHHVGRLLRSLRSRERDVVIAVTADHGEEFLEHGWLGHTRNLHGGLVRVPLLVHDSRRPEREVREDPAMLVDVHPTLLALAGLEVGEGPGRDLFRETGPRDLISEVEFGPRDSTPPEGDRETLDRERQLAKTAFQQAIQRDGWKAIRNRLDDSWSLYDVERDPGETRDLSAEHPERLRELAERLREWERSVPRGEGGELSLSEEDLDRLRGLGYVQ